MLGRVRGRGDVRPGIVTRLDRETSGVMLVALAPGVHARLQRQRLLKEYLAIVVGSVSPSRGSVDLPLRRDCVDRRRVVVAEDGAPSRTDYEVIATTDDVSVLRCALVTGRTHQIRVHLAAQGWPIAGDAKYGIRDGRIARTALHSWRVRLNHPVSGTPLEIVAPLPEDMVRCLTRVRHQ
jgi:23S rRNA pseudouridine1911/1915/1917 synthase